MVFPCVGRAQEGVAGMLGSGHHPEMAAVTMPRGPGEDERDEGGKWYYKSSRFGDFDIVEFPFFLLPLLFRPAFFFFLHLLLSFLSFFLFSFFFLFLFVYLVERGVPLPIRFDSSSFLA